MIIILSILVKEIVKWQINLHKIIEKVAGKALAPVDRRRSIRVTNVWYTD